LASFFGWLTDSFSNRPCIRCVYRNRIAYGEKKKKKKRRRRRRRKRWNIFSLLAVGSSAIDGCHIEGKAFSAQEKINA